MSRVIDNPKKLIFDSAKKIIQEEGYSSLSIRKIAKISNIAVGTVYNYYPNKKDIVMEMMSEYWEEYFCVLDEILQSQSSFYGKLEMILDNLSVFIKNFKEVWLKAEFYNQPGYRESGLDREYVYMDRLVIKIQSLLEEELKKNNKTINVDSYEMSKFITMNLIAIIQTKTVTFSSFETILKQLIE